MALAQAADMAIKLVIFVAAALYVVLFASGVIRSVPLLYLE